MALSIVVFGAAPGAPAGADDSVAAIGARHLAASSGGSPSDYLLVYERSASGLWAGKYVDQRTGAVRIAYVDPRDGWTSTAPPRAVASTTSALERKADDALRAAIAASDASLPVGVWLAADESSAVASVKAAHPELRWSGDQPLVDDLELARAVRAELWEARAAARAGAMATLAAAAEALGGSVGYASTAAPLAYVDVPARAVAALAEEPAVASLGLERSWVPAMSSAGPAVQADWSTGSDDHGAGVRVAVVEYHNVRPVPDLAGNLVATASATGTPAYTANGTFDHPTWVAGAVTGVAPGALIVSSSTGGGEVSVTRDRQIIAAADWAANPAGGDADVINTSIGQDTPEGSEEARRYFGALADVGGRLTVASAGNLVTFGNWNIVSPGTSWNALTVGGIDDRGTAGRNDDLVWYGSANGSSYLDPAGTPWNPHGDFNKPNVSAPAVSVQTVSGLTATGTSAATPIVAGIAAQVISRAPAVALRPEATRAIIMAGAITHAIMPDGSVNADHEGTGSASALWASRLLTAGDGVYGGHQLGDMTAGQTVTQAIEVRAGQKVKVVVSWNSDASYDLAADRLLADLDLRVVMPNGSEVGSYTLDNNYEWVEFTAPVAGTATIEVRQARFDGVSERYGLAWAKWSAGTPTRIAGANRYATAAAISAAHFHPGAPVAYIATGRDFPDALAAGAIAGIRGGPVLLTDPNSLPDATAIELARLQPGRIVVVGGPGVVSSAVVAALQAYVAQPVERLSGGDRYATSAVMSQVAFSPGVPAAFVATGRSFPDALTAGPAAAMAGGPVLLTEPNSLPDATAQELARLRPQNIYVVGGPGAVSDAVVGTLQAYAPVTRLAGSDRYGTAAAIATAFFLAPPSAYLATGANFPDALAAVPGAGRFGAPLLLVAASLPGPTADQLVRLRPPLTYVVGGGGAVGDAVVAEVVALLGKP